MSWLFDLLGCEESVADLRFLSFREKGGWVRSFESRAAFVPSRADRTLASDRTLRGLSDEPPEKL